MKFLDAIDGFSMEMANGAYSPITAKYYAQRLQNIAVQLDNPPLEQITREQLIGYLQSLRDNGRTESTVQVYWKVIRSFFNWASKELSIERVDNIPMPATPNQAILPFAQAEISKIVKSCKSARDKALVLLLLDSGLRVSEVSRLTINDLDIETGSILVKPFHSGKKSRGRVARLGKSARLALWKYIHTRDVTPTDPLISTRDNTILDRYQLRNILRRIGKRAGITNIHPHRFRHTFAIEFLRNGGNIFELQMLLGHNDLTMVRRYLAISQSDLESAHRRSSPADNWHL